MNHLTNDGYVLFVDNESIRTEGRRILLFENKMALSLISGREGIYDDRRVDQQESSLVMIGNQLIYCTGHTRCACWTLTKCGHGNEKNVKLIIWCLELSG